MLLAAGESIALFWVQWTDDRCRGAMAAQLEYR